MVTEVEGRGEPLTKPFWHRQIQRQAKFRG
jgi:hypothetical protein